MKRLLALAALVPAFAGAAPGDFAGSYEAPGPGLPISLELKLDEDGALRGAMSDGTTRFEVAGRTEDSTLSGQAFNRDQGEMLGFLAIMDPSGEWLAVALIPFDTNQAPLPALAEELAFRRVPVRPPPAP
jgi:hypothetical protein